MLRSEKYKQIIDDWESYLNIKTNTENLTTKGKKPIITVARKVIFKRNNKVLEFGKNLLITSSDEQLHHLRIAGKKFAISSGIF